MLTSLLLLSLSQCQPCGSQYILAPGGVSASWVYGDNVQTPWLRSQYIQPTLTTGVVILGNRTVDDLNDAVQVGRLVAQPDGGGSCLGVRNGQTAVGGWRCNGQATASGDPGNGAFVVGQNGSGTIAMECDKNGANGCYVPIKCHMKNGSHHGCLTVMNDGPEDGGVYYPLVLKGYGGPDSSQNIVLEVDAWGNLTIANGWIYMANSQPPACEKKRLGFFGYSKAFLGLAVCEVGPDGGLDWQRVMTTPIH